MTGDLKNPQRKKSLQRAKSPQRTKSLQHAKSPQRTKSLQRDKSSQPNQLISFIIPVLNEAVAIRNNLPALNCYVQSGHELIVVDGGSTDDSIAAAEDMEVQVISACGGRSGQMNAGARVANGSILLFLHIDTQLPPHADEMILARLRIDKKVWGRFDVRLSGQKPIFRLVEKLMNIRSRITGVATGDQGIFALADVFRQVGGYADIALMEDVFLSKSLRSLSRPVCIGHEVISSSRRWEKHGIARTIVLMWGLRLAYFLGVPANKLARYYSTNSGLSD